MKKLLSAILCAVEVIGAHAATSWVQYDTTTKRITLPTNLFMANTSALTAALTAAGWTQGIGTNASRIFFDGTAVDSPNILSGPEILLTIAGVTNITPTIKTNSIGTNQFNNTTYAAIFSGAIAESRVDAAIARLLSPAFTGSPTAPTAADGTSNTVLATTAWVLRNVAGGGGVGDVTLAGTNLFTGPNTFEGATVVSNLTVPGTLSVGSITSDTPLGMAIGGTGGTNAISARSSLGVAYDVDVQAYRLGLLQAAIALTADGHMVYHNGTLVTNLTSTAAGRALLTAASASAQWNNYLLSVATTNGTYDASAWNGVTDRTVTLDQFRDAINALPGGSNAITSVTAPLSLTNGVLSIDTIGLGGGGGGVTWLTNVSLGSWQGRDAGTNWNVMTFTVSSNDVPSTVGQYLNGEVSCVISNASGGTAAIVFVTSLNGSTIFKDTYTLNNMASIIPGRLAVNRFHLIRETTGTLSIVGLGAHSANADPGLGDTSASLTAWTLGATNVTYAGGDVTLTFEIQSESTNTSPASLGIRRVAASLMKYSAATGSGTGNVTGPASSTNNAIVLFSGTGGTNIIDSGVLVSDLAPKASPALTGDPTAPTASPGDKDTSIATTAFVENVRTNLDAGNVTSGTLASNRLPAAISLTSLSAGTLTATSVSGDGSGLTNLNGSSIASGTVAATRIDTAIARTASPTLASPTLNDTVTYEQTVLAAHSSVTNFVADPTVSPYQTINADLTTPFATVGFLHATNVAAGRQTTILVFAGTNASVTVSLAAQFARNTNSVALTTGQILPISFYGYGSSPTNVVATMGTVYTR